MKLTKLKALELCEEMWRWLAKHPKADKYEWFKRNEKIYIQNILSGCFACEYYLQKYPRKEKPGSINCHKDCILQKLWPNGCGFDDDSPYRKWICREARKKNALLIADFCKKEIAKLKRKK